MVLYVGLGERLLAGFVVKGGPCQDCVCHTFGPVSVQGYAAPATFERLMDRVLQGLWWTRCLVYLDDIISFGSSFSDALDNSLKDLGHMAYSWSLQSVTFSRRRYRSWDISSVDVGWSASLWRLRTSSLGRFKIALRVFASSWGLSAIIDGLYQILLILQLPWWRWQGRMSHLFGIQSARQLFMPCVTHLYMHLFWLFRQRPGQYILDTDASNFGLGGVLSQIQGDVERVVAYCSRALRPSQRRYCTTKREMLAAVAMCIQFRSYLCGAKFTLRTDQKSLVWLHRSKIWRVWWPDGYMLCSSSSFP